jgi:hypothetical protein
MPKAQIFRFENFWLEHPDFMDIVKTTWGMDVRASNIVSKIAAKFKLITRVLKRWSKGLTKFKQQLKQCNEVLEVLDKLEENRPLYNVEATFRDILKKHVAKMLENQRSYWKQRYTIRWTKLMDECSKKIHAAATERYMLNTITSLVTLDERIVSSHAKKAALLWEEYKERLGVTIQTKMHFDFETLVTNHDLQSIDHPFTQEDIDLVIKQLPADKALGPDGFNGSFLKKCWPIIKHGIYQLCLEFFNDMGDIQCINKAFISLVPKVNNPTSVNEYRPISLINCIVKTITKLLGNRLQKVIIPLIHQNQYGFIKTRTIQDCLAWAFEYIHQCHHSRRQIIILKLDFTKAFDTVEYSTILHMMQHLGFSDK